MPRHACASISPLANAHHILRVTATRTTACAVLNTVIPLSGSYLPVDTLATARFRCNCVATVHTVGSSMGAPAMSLVRVHNFAISLDGFGAGEPQSREQPFGHAG